MNMEVIKMRKNKLLALFAAMVLVVFCLAGCGSSGNTENEEVSYTMDNWTKNVVELDTGINMCYYEVGPEDGNPLVLLHGVTDAAVSWEQVAPILAEDGNHCYIMEYRGNGSTDDPDNLPEGYTAGMIADDVLNLMDKIGLEKTDIAGHSYGSLIIQELAVKAPERFDSLTLIDSAVDCTENEVLLWAKDGTGDDSYDGVFGYEDAMPEAFLEDWAATDNEDEQFREDVLNNVKSMSMTSWQNLMTGLCQFNSEDIIGKITGPVLVIWGTEDSIFPQEDQDELKAGLANADAEFVEVEGSHNIYWDSKENAAKVADLINNFANK